MNPPIQTGCVTTCVVCGNYFEYEAKTRGRTFYLREVCDDCRGVALSSAKRRFHAKFDVKSAKEEHFHQTANKKELLKMSQAEVARRLRVTLHTERFLERQAILKIRNNPQLKDLFDTWLEEGAPSEAPDGRDAGEQLLDYQMAVLDWWAAHDKLVSRRKTKPEARATLKEIDRFQHQIVETLKKL